MNADKDLFVQKHITSATHQKRLERRNIASQVKVSPLKTFVNISSKESLFNFYSCKMLIDRNIVLYKIQHPSSRNIFGKHPKKTLPHHSTLRKTYLKKCEGLICRQYHRRFLECSTAFNSISFHALEVTMKVLEKNGAVNLKESAVFVSLFGVQLHSPTTLAIERCSRLHFRNTQTVGDHQSQCRECGLDDDARATPCRNGEGHQSGHP